MLCQLKSCGRCDGDLVLDREDWKCLQCAEYYYGDKGYPRGELRALSVPVPAGVTEEGSGSIGSYLSSVDPATLAPSRKGPYNHRAPRHINAIVRAKTMGEERWRGRNSKVIGYLDQGLSVREISLLTGRGPRQIRNVREKLADLREAGLA